MNLTLLISHHNQQNHIFVFLSFFLKGTVKTPLPSHFCVTFYWNIFCLLTRDIYPTLVQKKQDGSFDILLSYVQDWGLNEKIWRNTIVPIWLLSEPKMTGGTPGSGGTLRQKFILIDIWHLNIWIFEYLTIWIYGHLNIWTSEHLKIWTSEHWNIGTIDTLEHWNIGTLEHWNIWTFNIQSASNSILWYQLHWCVRCI